MTDQTDTLLPCPWCGEEPNPKLSRSTLDAGCWVNPQHKEDCIIWDVVQVWGRNEAEAIAAWNTRQPPKVTQEQLNEAVAKAALDAMLQQAHSEGHALGYATGNKVTETALKAEQNRVGDILLDEVGYTRDLLSPRCLELIEKETDDDSRN